MPTPAQALKERNWSSGFNERIQSLGNINGNVTINLANGSVITATITGVTQLSFSSVPSGTALSSITLSLWITNGGAFALTFSPALKWTGGVSPVFTAAGLDCLTLTSLDGGTTWYAQIAQDLR